MILFSPEKLEKMHFWLASHGFFLDVSVWLVNQELRYLHGSRTKALGGEVVSYRHTSSGTRLGTEFRSPESSRMPISQDHPSAHE